MHIESQMNDSMMKTLYKGCFKNGQLDGYGQEHHIDTGEIHIGEWKNGENVGKTYVCVIKSVSKSPIIPHIPHTFDKNIVYMQKFKERPHRRFCVV